MPNKAKRIIQQMEKGTRAMSRATQSNTQAMETGTRAMQATRDLGEKSQRVVLVMHSRRGPPRPQIRSAPARHLRGICLGTHGTCPAPAV
mmetsp:Transcript_4325/g.10053  ORF Transcript_4325/g.10053 Transcript_4325/m.10053 type:complete len:90 (-) Transcript_4325:944-1213(-)